MFAKIKEWFAPAKPGEGMIPISSADIKEVEEPRREWIYMGDGMMEEVIIDPADKVKIRDVYYAGRANITPTGNTRSQSSSSPSRASSYDSPMIHTTSFVDSPSNTSCDSGGGFTCD